MSFRAITQPTSEVLKSLEVDAKELTNKRYNSALPRRRLKSAALISQKRTTISQLMTTPSHHQQQPLEFFRKMNTFMSAISNNQQILADRIFNSPLADNHSNTNRFRPTFKRRSSRLRKFKEPLLLDQSSQLEVFIKTVTQEFGIAKPKLSLQLPVQG